MTLRLRIILTILAVLGLSSLVTWFGVRPVYEQALIEERTTIVTDHQQQGIAAADTRVRNWLRVTRELEEVLATDPMRIENVAQAYIRLFPDMQVMRVLDVRSGEFLQVGVPGAGPLPAYETIADSLFTIRAEESFEAWWDLAGNRFLVVKDMELGSSILRLLLAFRADGLRTDLLRNRLGEGSRIAVWLPDGRSLPDSIPLELRPDVGTAVAIRDMSHGGRTYLTSASPMDLLPVVHAVYADRDLVSSPVRRLFITTLGILGMVFLLLSVGAIVVADWIRKPLDRFLEDVTPFADVSFDRPFRESGLPELADLTRQMELIRLRLKRYQRINVEQIIVQEQRNRLFMTNSSMLVAHYGEKGNWLFRNPAFEALADQIRPDGDFETIDAFLDNPSASILDDSTESVVRDDVRIENRRFDLVLTTPEEAAYTLRAHRMETYASDGQHMGGFLLLNDVTQEREIDRMRTEMIHIIVHELQNPVAAVRGFIEILQEEQLDEAELQEIYALCGRSVETLRNLIDRFLAITRLESGKTEIEWEPVAMKSLIQEVSDGFRPMLKEKSLKLALELSPVPVILGSNAMLEDVLRNLISNAIKYGDPDRTIEVDLAADMESVIFRVTDHGYGIPEEHRSKMFQKFYRIKAYNRQKGNGLGLAYVREIVLKHRGTISFESNPDIGTRFIVRLPFNMDIDV